MAGHEYTITADGRRRCRPCAAAKHREWVANNADRYALMVRSWVAAHPDYRAEWRKANRERVNDLQRERRRKAKRAQP